MRVDGFPQIIVIIDLKAKHITEGSMFEGL